MKKKPFFRNRKSNGVRLALLLCPILVVQNISGSWAEPSGATARPNTARPKLDDASRKISLSVPPQTEQNNRHQSSQDSANANPQVEGEAAHLLSPVGIEVANNLSILPTLDDYLKLKARPKQTQTITLDEVVLRQQVIETVLMALLDSQRITAEIEDEVDHTTELLNRMENKRDARVRNNNIANFVTSGVLQIIGSGVQIGTQTPWQNAGNEIEVVTGGFSTSLSAYQLRLGKGGKYSGGAHPNMLAKIFDRTPAPDTQYPDSIWSYLLSAPPGLKESRRQLLIDRWVANQRIPSPNTRHGQRQIDLITASVPQNHTITIDLLDNRAAMLTDLRITLSQFTKSLAEILQVIRSK